MPCDHHAMVNDANQGREDRYICLRRHYNSTSRGAQIARSSRFHFGRCSVLFVEFVSQVMSENRDIWMILLTLDNPSGKKLAALHFSLFSRII